MSSPVATLRCDMFSALENIKLVSYCNDETDAILDWHAVLQHQIMNICMIFCPGLEASGSARGWMLTMITEKAEVFALYPQPGKDGAMKVVVRPLLGAENTRLGHGWEAMNSFATIQRGRMVVPNTRMIDVLHAIADSGLTNYKLVNNNGLRFWLLAALYGIQNTIIQEPSSEATLSREMGPLMTICDDGYWHMTEKHLEKGRIIPHLCKRGGFASYMKCMAENL
ncbi:hypothetical protein AB5N19_00607 [Seiridium cardinale]